MPRRRLPLGLAQNSDLKTQIRDFPPDLRQYTRSALPEDLAPGGKPAIEPASSIFIRDVVVSNTDKGLKNSNNSPNGEPSIAINPMNTNELLGASNPLAIEDSDSGVASARAAGFAVLRISDVQGVARAVREFLNDPHYNFR